MVDQIAVEKILEKVKFRDWKWRCGMMADGCFIQAAWRGTDSATGEPVELRGRKWFVSRHSLEDEVVKTCWLAVEVALKHEAMEEFLYDGKAPFHPHHPVQHLIHCAEEHRQQLNPTPINQVPANLEELGWPKCCCGSEKCPAYEQYCNLGYVQLTPSSTGGFTAIVIHRDSGGVELLGAKTLEDIWAPLQDRIKKLGGINPNAKWAVEFRARWR